jgi:FAD/FMN-containing dehydrogenase
LEWSADTFAAKPYLAVQGMNDDAMSWGHRFYMKGAFLAELSDDVIAACAVHATDVPAGGDCSISSWSQGGAISRTPEDGMAFTGRGAGWSVTFEAMWDEPAQDESHIAWSRRAMAAVKPFTTAGQYVNDVAEAGTDGAQIYGKAKYERLVGLKRKYDPDNVFRLNQNIRP